MVDIVLNGVMAGGTSSGPLWSSLLWFKDVSMLEGLGIKSHENGHKNWTFLAGRRHLGVG